ncbi:uncharacterized protein LOC123518695 [Portunus trituberculatus]|uniref:uncharacterized protein LOC123518695 n=1 Tax=Portunus trituberculatus TaxID=210409 RepID=UPI001E1D1FBB|nr:uncharacterized protein LOC123518695 [Portunus trituberculatus]
MDKFLGKWHVLLGSNLASRCHSLTIRQGGLEGSAGYTVEVEKQLYSLHSAGLLHKLHYEAEMTQNSQSPASLLLRLPAHVYGDVVFDVVGTDYTTWAALYSCSSTLFGHLHAGLVLGRAAQLDLSSLMLARDSLEGLGIDLGT